MEREALEVEAVPIDGRLVHLEIAGVDDGALRRLDRETERTRDAVRHLDELHRERTEADLLSGLHPLEMLLVRQVVLAQLARREAEREIAAVHRHAHLVEQPGKGPDVILVCVRQEDAAHLGGALLDVGQLRNDEVHAERLFLREQQAGVDDDEIGAVPQDGAVAAELADTAQRHDLQGSAGVPGVVGPCALGHGGDYRARRARRSARKPPTGIASGRARGSRPAPRMTSAAPAGPIGPPPGRCRRARLLRSVLRLCAKAARRSVSSVRVAAPPVTEPSSSA